MTKIKFTDKELEFMWKTIADNCPVFDKGTEKQKLTLRVMKKLENY